MLLIRACFLLFVLSCLTVWPVLAQSDSSFLQQASNKLSQQPAAEKVYLHLDKQNYVFGDTIWYKAYTVIGQHHQLSALSGVLYAELINQKDSVVSRQTLHLVSGIAWGELAISKKLKPGNYSIRAYTNWMRNFDPAYFYEQKITIGGVMLSTAKPDAVKNPDVQFFPEAGQLVNGIRSRVAIKVVGANGLGEDIKGTIEDSDGNVVADFATQHLGMGVFAIIPQSGKTYRAKISTSGETTFTADLPKAVGEGFTLALNNSSPDSIFIKVAVNEKVLTDRRNSAFFIIAQNNGKVYYTSQGKLESLVYSARVEKSRFPTGITQFTLFSQSGEPLAERIAFIIGADSLNIKVSNTDKHYAVRQKVNFDLTADNAGKPSTGTFSVAVINESRAAVDENSEGTILNNLMISSELKGYIEQPNYYFTNSNPQKQADLDILMLTQGYRRFEWKQILENASPGIVFQPEHDLEIAGTLKTPGGKPISNGKVTLFAAAEKAAMDTATDVNGNFRFTGLDLSDTAKVILRARKEHNGSNVAIYVKQPDYPAPAIGSFAGQNNTPNIGLAEQNYADDHRQMNGDTTKNPRQLKEVTIKDKQLAKPDSYNQYGTVMEYHVDMKRLQAEFFNIKDALIYLVPGLKGGPTSFVYEDRQNGPVKFIIDGFERSASDLNYFLPKEVDNIRVVSRTGFGPPVLILTTKRYAGTDTTSAIRLKEVKIRSSKPPHQPELAHSDNLNGPGKADQIIMGNELEGGGALSDCLQGKVMGVTFPAGVPLSIRRRYAKMAVIVDGNVLDGNHLNDISPNDIYSIEVLRSATFLAIYGSSAGAGALVITTKRGGEHSPGTDTTSKSISLKQVNIKSTKATKKPELTHSANLNGPGNANQVIMGNKLEGCVTLSDCLKGKVFGVKFGGGGTPVGLRKGLPMTLIVDGVMMPGSHLNDLNANDIYSIEVLRSGQLLSIYGTNASGGALVITTKRGGETYEDDKYLTSTAPSGIITYPFKGYHAARVFYSPKYTHQLSTNELPDLRNTIYWNPNIITDKDGHASFEYFNNDTKGSYRVVVEGIDDYGNLGMQVYRYKVE